MAGCLGRRFRDNRKIQYPVTRHTLLPESNVLAAQEIKPLTAIRGIAAIWVVSHHLTLFFRFPDLNAFTKILFLGFSGVDIFFILSGFILATVYHGLTLRAVPDFALRRVLRIYPLHLVILTVLASCAYAHFIWPVDPSTWRNLPKIALLVNPYFNISWNWNPVTWSAGVELSFYFIFPLAVMLLRRFSTDALALLAIAAAYLEWQTQTAYGGAFVGLPCVLRGMGGAMFGVSLGLLAIKYRLPRRAALIGELAAAATIAWACYSFDAQLLTLAAGGLIWALDRQAGPIAWVLSTRVPVFLGRVSYSIYLLHLPLFFAMGHFWPVFGHPPLTAVFVLRETIFFALLFGLSSATYYLIERPARNLWRMKPKTVAAPQEALV
jgi:peptidoglycan/LPS O-acetylase OafA/YrhL